MTMTNTASAAPAAKKPKINQFRRLLWHVNRTDLGWVTKAPLTSLQLGARAKRIELLNSLPVAPEWSEASRQLSEQGYVDVTSIVDRGLAEAVAQRRRRTRSAGWTNSPESSSSATNRSG